MSRIQFSPEPAKVQHAIAVSFDLSGFSTFCRRPDAHGYLNRYLSCLFELFDKVFEDGWRDFWKGTTKLVQVPRPDYAKYTGDGALLLWVQESGDKFSNEFCTALVAAMRHFQLELPKSVSDWERQWRVSDLPKSVRIGIAIGPVHPLSTPEALLEFAKVVDYAGYCINLAIRLQDHCPDVGFIIQAPLRPQLEGLESFRAVKIKGSMDETVYVFYEDFSRAERLDRKYVQSRFHPIQEE